MDKANRKVFFKEIVKRFLILLLVVVIVFVLEVFNVPDIILTISKYALIIPFLYLFAYIGNKANEVISEKAKLEEEEKKGK